MIKSISSTAALFLLSVCMSVLADPANPYEIEGSLKVSNAIDRIMLADWQRRNIEPANLCSDAAFVRRAHIDLTGTLPTPGKSRSFIASDAPGKRENLIDELLASDTFSVYFSLKWCDILRVKSEFPIKMWPNAVQAYHHWVLSSLRENKPYDQFARELLTSSGSNFREPAVNFFRGNQDRTPHGLAKGAALTFLASRTETWPDASRLELEKFFSRVAMKGTAEWKEEVVFLDPAPALSMRAELPDGTVVALDANSDPRQVFADWLTSPDNLWFAQAAVNRAWFWIFGRGIVEEPDDFRLAQKKAGEEYAPFWDRSALANVGNPPANRELLNVLAEEFIRSGYDFRALCRLIMCSSVYQQSCIPKGQIDVAEPALAVYPLRRLDAEVLIDTFTEWGDLPTSYVSVIPEPFTFIPAGQRTIELADGSISSAFLETFGRPARDTGQLRERSGQFSYSQRLYLLNSPEVLWKVSRGPFLQELIKRSRGNPADLVDNIYLATLSRYPTPEELDILHAAAPALATPGRRPSNRRNPRALREAGGQLFWALINSKEFLFQH